MTSSDCCEGLNVFRGLRTAVLGALDDHVGFAPARNFSCIYMV